MISWNETSFKFFENLEGDKIIVKPTQMLLSCVFFLANGAKMRSLPGMPEHMILVVFFSGERFIAQRTEVLSFTSVFFDMINLEKNLKIY